MAKVYKHISNHINIQTSCQDVSMRKRKSLPKRKKITHTLSKKTQDASLKIMLYMYGVSVQF